MKNKIVEEEGCKITSFGDHISKELAVFYNPQMKLNRDIALLIIASYFEKPIKFCDPMIASGIREIRFLKTIPKKFEKMICGDISKDAIQNTKQNLKLNKIQTDKLELHEQNAINTISTSFFDFIEIDPFGSPVPFIDIACQRIRNDGILSITATDTAALCGTYPKTSLRKYGIKTTKPYWEEELGLRNLIAYCQRQAAKYNRSLIPLIAYSHKHYYKIFLKTEKSRTKALETIKKLSYIKWDRKTQQITIENFETKESIGKTYIGPINNKNLLKKIKQNLFLINQNKELSNLIDKLIAEPDVLGYYNPHKLEKSYKFACNLKFDEIIEKLKKKGFQASKVHNDNYGIKTNADHKTLLKIMGYTKNPIKKILKKLIQ